MFEILSIDVCRPNNPVRESSMWKFFTPSVSHRLSTIPPGVVRVENHKYGSILGEGKSLIPWTPNEDYLSYVISTTLQCEDVNEI